MTIGGPSSPRPRGQTWRRASERLASTLRSGCRISSARSSSPRTSSPHRRPQASHTFARLHPLAQRFFPLGTPYSIDHRQFWVDSTNATLTQLSHNSHTTHTQLAHTAHTQLTHNSHTQLAHATLSQVSHPLVTCVAPRFWPVHRRDALPSLTSSDRRRTQL